MYADHISRLGSIALQSAASRWRPFWVELGEPRPEMVEAILHRGFHFDIGLCDDGTVLKYPEPYHDANVARLRHEQEIYETLYETLCPDERIEHIIKYLGFDEGGISLEYAENGDLRRWILKDSDMTPLKHRLEWAQQVAEGLAHLHRNEIIHGDLMCRNVLLDKDLDVKLCDFERSSLRGNRADASIEKDIHNLGSVIFELITEKDPWTEQKSSPHGVMEDLLERKQYRRMSSATKEIITKCWKKGYHSAEEAVNDLKAVTDAFTHGE